MSTVLEMKGLIKKYGDRIVVNGVSLEVKKGECFGILGPNGAGKSSLMKMMYGSSLPTEGELYVLSLNSKNSIREIKARVGVVPQDDGLDIEFTAMENLMIFGRFHGIDERILVQRAEDLLRLVRLEEYANRYVQVLSGGMKRRLAIARSMINHPDLIFLDEPTTGLDPQARIWIWEFLNRIKIEMGTLIMTTHYMEEAEQVCDRIAILDQGKLLAIGSPHDLILKEIGTEVIEFEFEPQDLQYYLGRLKENMLPYQVLGKTIRVHLHKETNPTQDGRRVLSLISSPRMTMRQPTLNDVFLKLAGHDLREEPR
jgi:lipooligosaccharide transport system ATP-binding protein